MIKEHKGTIKQMQKKTKKHPKIFTIQQKFTKFIYNQKHINNDVTVQFTRTKLEN